MPQSALPASEDSKRLPQFHWLDRHQMRAEVVVDGSWEVVSTVEEEEASTPEGGCWKEEAAAE